jgi:uncharacterized membrane protein YedE/YeeE
MMQDLMMGTMGGLLIGLSVAVMLLFVGRITGISGIVGGVIVPQKGETAWRVSFTGGLLAGGLLLWVLYPKAFPVAQLQSMSWGIVILAGLLVGVGTRMGSGCTSGHGICGIARFSVRSIVATLMFIATGAITVFLARHILKISGI